MRPSLVAAPVALFISILGTPIVIALFRRGYGQEIRDDGPQTHQSKRGTPTMGGTVIIIATLVGYFAHLLVTRGPPSRPCWCCWLMTGLGVVGFLDDYIKIYRQRSLGLRARAKLAGRRRWRSPSRSSCSTSRTPRVYAGIDHISFVRDIGGSVWVRGCSRSGAT